MRIGSDYWYTAPILAERIIWRKFLSIRSLKKKWRKSAIQQIHMIFCKFENFRQKKQFSWNKIKIRVQLNTFWVAKKKPSLWASRKQTIVQNPIYDRPRNHIVTQPQSDLEAQETTLYFLVHSSHLVILFTYGNVPNIFKEGPNDVCVTRRRVVDEILFLNI